MLINNNKAIAEGGWIISIDARISTHAFELFFIKKRLIAIKNIPRLMGTKNIGPKIATLLSNNPTKNTAKRAAFSLNIFLANMKTERHIRIVIIDEKNLNMNRYSTPKEFKVANR